MFFAMSLYSGSGHPKPAGPARPAKAKAKPKPKVRVKAKAKPKCIHVAARVAPVALDGLAAGGESSPLPFAFSPE